MIPTHPEPPNSSQRSAAIARIGTSPDSDSGFVRLPSKLLISRQEAAAMLSIGRTKLFQLIADGQLPSVRIAGCRRIPVAVLERFVQLLLDTEAEGSRCG